MNGLKSCKLEKKVSRKEGREWEKEVEEKSDIWWCCFPRSTARTHLPGVRFQGFVCIIGSQHVRQISEISICNFWKWYWKNPRDWLDLPANASYPTHIQLPRALAVSNDVVKHLVKKFEKAKPWRNGNEQHEEWNVRIKNHECRSGFWDLRLWGTNLNHHSGIRCCYCRMTSRNFQMTTKIWIPTQRCGWFFYRSHTSTSDDWHTTW